MSSMQICFLVFIGLVCGIQCQLIVPQFPNLQSSVVDAFVQLISNIQNYLNGSGDKPSLIKGIQDNLADLLAAVQVLGQTAFNSILSQVLAHESTQQILATLSSLGINLGKREIKASFNDFLQQLQLLGASSFHNIVSQVLAHESTQQVLASLTGLGKQKRGLVNIIEEIIQMVLPYLPEWLKKILNLAGTMLKVLA